MTNLKNISKPVGFYTLSKKDDEFILKVMFTEGDYKVDGARFFCFRLMR